MRPSCFLILFSILFTMFVPESICSKMSETTINKNSELFLRQLLLDNPDEEDAINRLSKAIIKNKRAGIRFKDKCAIIISELSAKNIQLIKTRLATQKNRFLLLLFLNDHIENNSYILYLEYKYVGSENHVILLDIHVSIIFDEKLSEIKHFFEAHQ